MRPSKVMCEIQSHLCDINHTSSLQNYHSQQKTNLIKSPRFLVAVHQTGTTTPIMHFSVFMQSVVLFFTVEVKSVTAKDLT